MPLIAPDPVASVVKQKLPTAQEAPENVLHGGAAVGGGRGGEGLGEFGFFGGGLGCWDGAFFTV